jgi:hypothetical protein
LSSRRFAVGGVSPAGLASGPLYVPEKTPSVLTLGSRPGDHVPRRGHRRPERDPDGP